MSFSFNKAASTLMVVDTAPVLIHPDSFDGEFHWHTDDGLKVEGHPRTDCHETPCGRGDWRDELRITRPCIHLLTKPAPVQLMPASWAHQLRWFPQLFVMDHTPIIASRIGLDVTLMWDCYGALDNCANQPTKVSDCNRMMFTLHPIEWAGERQLAPGVLAGVQK